MCVCVCVFACMRMCIRVFYDGGILSITHGSTFCADSNFGIRSTPVLPQ